MPIVLDPYEMLLSQMAMPKPSARPARLDLGTIAPGAGMFGAARGALGVPLPDPSTVQVPAEPSPLAASDPTNSRWRRDLSVSHEKIGDVRRERMVQWSSAAV